VTTHTTVSFKFFCTYIATEVFVNKGAYDAKDTDDTPAFLTHSPVWCCCWSKYCLSQYQHRNYAAKLRKNCCFQRALPTHCPVYLDLAVWPVVEQVAFCVALLLPGHQNAHLMIRDRYNFFARRFHTHTIFDSPSQTHSHIVDQRECHQMGIFHPEHWEH